MSVHHMPGRLMVVADALSRRPDYYYLDGSLSPVSTPALVVHTSAVEPSAVASVDVSPAATLSVNQLTATTLISTA